MSDFLPSAPSTSAVDVIVGRAIDWHEPGWGTFLADVPHAFATREIDSVPGEGELPFGSQPRWQVMRSVALGILASAAFMPGCDGLELRYTSTPSRDGPSRVQMFVTAKARDWHPAVAEAAVEAACLSLPKGFTSAAPNRSLGLGQTTQVGATTLELHRDEEVTIPQWDYVPAEFYYTVNDDPGDGSGWPMFWHILASAAGPVAVSLLFKQTELHWDERNVLASVTTDLSVYAEQHTDYDAFGNQVFYPACANAKAALVSWEKRIEQLHRPLLARVAVRADVEVAAAVATALASAIASTTGVTGTHPMYVEAPMNEGDRRQADFSFDWLEILPWGGHPFWTNNETRDDAPHSLRRLPYLYGLNEAASLALLPVPDEQGVPGFVRARRLATHRAAIMPTDESSPGVLLGEVLHHGQSGGRLVLPLTAINRHVLTVGAPGSGKTTTVLSILAELWRKHRIPFLAIEPTKTEYRGLLNAPGFEDLYVIALGREDISPLRLNPFAPPPHVRCESHISVVMASLKMALPLFPPLPQLLAKALDRTYERAGWDEDTTIEDDIPAPTLRALLESFDVIFEQAGYRGEARNVAVAGRVRLESLLRGSLGRMLDTVESVDFASLMGRPVIIELDEIADAEDKAVLSAFVLDRIRAAAKARHSTGGELVHVTVIEEAHRLLSKVPSRGGDAGSDPRAEAVRAFTEAIAELRALGEGFILSSQSPSVLPDSAVANTGTRILHRLESAADRAVVLDDLDASQLDREAAARLRQGEAVVRWPDRDEAELVQVSCAEGIDSGRPVGDDVVADRMAEARRRVQQLLPYPLCTREVCRDGCSRQIRTGGKRIATDLRDEARAAWTEARPKTAQALKVIAPLLAAASDDDLQLAYCGAAHLGAAGDAFAVPGKDIRQHLAMAIREVTEQS